MRLALACPLATLIALVAAPAQAQLFRAYLTLDGVDTNPCTLQQPCRLLPAALAAVQAGGEIWMLDSANYNSGPVNVTKSVTILAIPGALGSVVALGGNAFDINTTGSVTLRNLNLLPFPGNESARGVQKIGTGSLTVQDCNIFGFKTMGAALFLLGVIDATVTRTLIRDNHYGITTGSGAVVGISDSLFANNSEYAANAGGHVAGITTRISVTRSVARNNTTSFSAESGVAGAAARFDISESRIEGSGPGGATFGARASATGGGSAIVSVSNTAINGLGTGVVALGSAEAKLFLSGNQISDNGIGAQKLDGAIMESAGNNGVANNATNVSPPGGITNVGKL